MKILVIDDDAIVRDVIGEMLLVGGYEVISAATAAEALELFVDDEIGLVVSDIVMPDMSGLELLEAMRLHRPGLPIVLVSGANTRDNLSEALTRGADGFVAKPFTQAELQQAVDNALDRAGKTEQDLRDRLLAPTLTSALANAIEAREEGMRGHCERLTVLAMRLGMAVGLGEEEIETIRLGALLHDIGKIGIPDRILLKPSSLTPEETELMRTHTIIGDNLLEPIDLLTAVRPIVRSHHERWDGLGYPDGLTGEEIPLGARIMAVADAVEAMSAKRVYRDPLSEPEIVRELERGRGTQWEAPLVDLVLRLIETDSVSFSADGVRISQVLPHRTAAAVLRFPAAKSRAELLSRTQEATQ
ncbi:MAG: HD domain-containing phosphohydrolase [Actinomycetota bacterium]